MVELLHKCSTCIHKTVCGKANDYQCSIDAIRMTELTSKRAGLNNVNDSKDILVSIQCPHYGFSSASVTLGVPHAKS